MTGMEEVALGLRQSASRGVEEFRALSCPACGSGLRSYSAKTSDFVCEQGHSSAAGGGVSVSGRRRATPGPRVDPSAARSRGSGVGEASVLGPITAGSPSLLARRLADLSGARALLVTVDSTGGDLEAAWQMHDALRSCGVPVVAYVSRAESAATVVALACEHVVLRPGGWLMVHRPASDDETVRQAEQDRLAALYLGRTAEDEESVLGFLEGGADVHLSSLMALGRGWADSLGNYAAALAVAKELAAGRAVTPSPRALALGRFSSR